MKATFFYSKKQEEADKQSPEPNRFTTFIDGKPYTECMTRSSEHKSGWDDAVIVSVVEDLPIHMFTWNQTGARFADTTPINHRLTHKPK